MTMAASVASGHDTITVQVPLTFTRGGGRKQIILPDGTSRPRRKVTTPSRE